MMEECRRMRDKMKDRNSKQQEKAVVGRGGGGTAGSLFVKFEKQRGKSRKREGRMCMLSKRCRQM